MQAGTKTLQELILEQEQEILKLSSKYESHVSGDDLSCQGVQGDVVDAKEWLKKHTMETLKAEDWKTIQGVQGLNCEHFRVWLENCTKHSFLQCDNQLEDFKANRKTLQEIFEEQERIIKQVALDCQKKEANMSLKQVAADMRQHGVLSTIYKLRLSLRVFFTQYGVLGIVFHQTVAFMALGASYASVYVLVTRYTLLEAVCKLYLHPCLSVLLAGFKYVMFFVAAALMLWHC